MPLFPFVALASVGLLCALPSVKAFSFNATSLESCGNLTVNWSGGTSPYYLTVTPIFGSPRNFSIPNSAFSSGSGSFSTQVAFPENQKYILTMSDSTGFGSGGNSLVSTVADASSGSCNTTDPGTAFVYDLNDALQQCRLYTFSAYTDAVQPVTIMGIIPGGQAFTLSPPQGPDSFDWTANVLAGTSVVFIMIDAEGRQGGSSSLLTVAQTSDPSCLNSTSPSSTEAPTASSTSTPGSTSAPSSGSNNSGPSTGAVVGIVIGGLLFIAVVISLVLFCTRRRREQRNPSNWIEASGAFSSGHRGRSVDIDLLAGDEGTTSHPPYADSTQNSNSLRPILPNPYDDHRSSTFSRPTTQYTDSYAAPSSTHLLPPGSVTTPFTGAPPSTNRGIKGSMASSSMGAPRYILHHDAEDIVGEEEEEEEEVVELPPMYKPRVGPSTSGSASGPASTSGSTAFTDRKEPIPS